MSKPRRKGDAINIGDTIAITNTSDTRVSEKVFVMYLEYPNIQIYDNGITYQSMVCDAIRDAMFGRALKSEETG